MPRLHSFQADYGPHGFRSLTINLGDDWEVIKSYARTYSSLYLKDNGSAWPVYRQNGYIPTNYVIDTSGVIRYIAEGFSEPTMRQIIEQYLPDPIEHDVGVLRLWAPTGSVDSGVAVTPSCTLYNFRNHTESYLVRMRIGTRYDTTVLVTGHTPYTRRYVEFPTWIALERGQIAVRCSTELDGDDIASNDLATNAVSVQVYDVAVTAIFAPPDTVDSGAVVAPRVEVRNLGTLSEFVTVRFRVGDGYFDSVNVALQVGRMDTAVLRNWTALQIGSFPVACTVRGRRGEMVPANNQLQGSVLVRSLGIEEPVPTSDRFALFGACPNPTSGRTALRYSLGAASPVEIRLYSADGTLIRSFVFATQPPGSHQLVWDGRDELRKPVRRGIYYCRMSAGAFQAVRKLTAVD